MPRNIEGLIAARNRILEISNESQKRVLVGVVGKPGAGKSTVTAELRKILPPNETRVLSGTIS